MYDVALIHCRRAREFRYDGARARYMNRKLSADLITDLGTTWSDYDGDEAYGDFTVSGSTVTNTDSYEPELWRRVSGAPDYLHNDHLGTLRQTTGTTGFAGASRVFTAFGERLPGSATDRFGYVGAFGYQSHSIPESPNPDTVFPFLHVGARYYDPSSGRFLQRDPIGIVGGLNVYAYARLSPTVWVDPEGLTVMECVASGYLWITGGRNSWLDDPNAVRTAQTIAASVGAAAAGAAAVGVAVGAATGGAGASALLRLRLRLPPGAGPIPPLPRPPFVTGPPFPPSAPPAPPPPIRPPRWVW